MELKHFSHEHSLIFNEEKNIEDVINPDDFCVICNLPILLSSFYSCSNTGCKYLLHQPCALLLTETLDHPWFPSSRFRLQEKPPNDHSYCKRCCQLCENFTYNYKFLSYRQVDSFHPRCAIPLQIKSKHKSHPLHALVAVGKKITAVCDACAQEQNGNFFVCHDCDFWIHVDCALLPRIVKCEEHSHYLILTYSRCDKYQNEVWNKCLICSEKMSGSGAYSCGTCKKYAHLSCAIKDLEDLGTETELEVADLPGDDPNAFRGWMIERLQGMEFDDEDSVFVRKVLHDHPLILYEDIENSDSSSNNKEPYLSQELITCCNACMQPIYPPLYACSQSHESGKCHFHLHQSCSHLPSRIKIDHNVALELRTWSTKENLCSLFYCGTCNLGGNGFHYQLTSHDDKRDRGLDILCCAIPNIIKHMSHKQHVLQLTLDASGRRTMNCCHGSAAGRSYGLHLYRCIDCDFTIDRRCATLPIQVKHKFDPHPLNLITTGIANPDYNNLCEFCEEHIDTKFWHYGCEKCDNLFHVKCIPSVGSLSKVKFGNSITVSCHPSHPVTFIRMLEFGSQTCGYCKETIKGFVDDMAFHCSKCDFWVHFRCAEKCTGAKIFQHYYKMV